MCLWKEIYISWWSTLGNLDNMKTNSVSWEKFEYCVSLIRLYAIRRLSLLAWRSNVEICKRNDLAISLSSRLFLSPSFWKFQFFFFIRWAIKQSSLFGSLHLFFSYELLYSPISYYNPSHINIASLRRPMSLIYSCSFSLFLSVLAISR